MVVVSRYLEVEATNTGYSGNPAIFAPHESLFV
jgi:hypothetical protein